MEMKLAFDSFATALASKVFPVPGGPDISTPFDGLMPALVNKSGRASGAR